MPLFLFSKQKDDLALARKLVQATNMNPAILIGEAVELASEAKDMRVCLVCAKKRGIQVERRRAVSSVQQARLAKSGTIVIVCRFDNLREVKEWIDEMLYVDEKLREVGFSSR